MCGQTRAHQFKPDWYSECTAVYLPNEEVNTVNVEIGDEGEIYVEEKPHINETVSQNDVRRIP